MKASEARSYIVKDLGCKRSRTIGHDLTDVRTSGMSDKPPEALALTPESVLPLPLLDLRTAGSLDDVRAFDLKAKIAESETTVLLLSILLEALSGGSKNEASPHPQDGSRK